MHTDCGNDRLPAKGSLGTIERLMGEELVLLDDARKLFPQHPSKSAVWRWATGRGLLGVRLESILIARNRYTSKAATTRFIQNVNAADAARKARHHEQQHQQPTPAELREVKSAREVEIDLARKRLAAAGL